MKEPKERKIKFKRKLFRVLAITAAILIGAVLFHEYCQLEHMVVSGTNRYTQEEILSFLKKRPTDQYAVLLWLRNKVQPRKDIPFIEKMDLTLVNRNTIEVRVYEKMVIGCVYVMGEYLYFDRDGLVTDGSPSRIEELPLVTGLQFESIVVGRRFSVQNDEVMPTILQLTRLIDLYELPVDEIHFQKEGAVILHSGGSFVHLGKKENFDVPLAALGKILQSLDGRNVNLHMENYDETHTDVTAEAVE